MLYTEVPDFVMPVMHSDNVSYTASTPCSQLGADPGTDFGAR